MNAKPYTDAEISERRGNPLCVYVMGQEPRLDECEQRWLATVDSLQSRFAAAEAAADRARGLRVEENIVVEAAILWAGRRSDDLPSAVNLLEAVNALLRKRAHPASRPEHNKED